MSSREDLKQEVEAELSKLTPEEGKSEEVNEVLVTNETQDQDPYLEEALKSGYNPNYQGANKKTPEQFVKDGSFFRKIDELKKQLDQQSEAMKLIVEHNKQKEIDAYKKGIDEALARRRAAVEVGDVEEFNKADAELQDLNKKAPSTGTIAPNAPVQQHPEVTKELTDFIEQNKSWFNNQTPENERMVVEADGLYELEKKYNPHLSQKEILEVVLNKVKALHPDRFENPNKERAPKVSGNTGVAKSGSKTDYKLTPRQQKIFEMAKDIDPSLKIEDYVKNLSTGE